MFFCKADRNLFEASVLLHRTQVLPCMCPLVGVESGKQSRELQQYGDPAAVRVRAVRQPLKEKHTLNITTVTHREKENGMRSLPEQLRKSRSEPPGR